MLSLLAGGALVVVHAQAPVTEWSHRYGGSYWDYVEDIRACPDGSYVVVGRTFSNDGDVSGNHDPDGHNADIWLIKLDSAGLLQWQRCYGSFTPEEPARVVVTEDHGFIVAGTANFGGNPNGDVSGCHGGKDGWVFRTDSQGDLIWQRCLGGSMEDELHDMVLTADGGVALIGHTRSNDGDVSGLTGNGPDMWFVTLDADGNLTGQRCFDTQNGVDYGRSIVEGPNGKFTILGHRQYGIQCPWGNYQLHLFNFNPTGNITWQTCFGGSNFEYSEFLFRTANGDLLVAGATLSNDHHGTGNHDPTGTYYDALIARTNSEGVHQWVRVLGGSDHDVAMHWGELPNGDLLMLGWTRSNDGDVSGNHGSHDVWLVRLSASGETLGSWCFGGSSTDSGIALQVDPDGSVVIVARTSSFDGDLAGTTGGPLTDYWIFKLTFPDITLGMPVEGGTAPTPNVSMNQGMLVLDCGTVWLHDMSGRVVRSTAQPGSVISLGVSDMAPGIYMVRGGTDGSRWAQRILITP